MQVTGLRQLASPSDSENYQAEQRRGSEHYKPVQERPQSQNRRQHTELSHREQAANGRSSQPREGFKRPVGEVGSHHRQLTEARPQLEPGANQNNGILSQNSLTPSKSQQQSVSSAGALPALMQNIWMTFLYPDWFTMDMP